MPYIPPEYIDLFQETQQLEGTFSAIAKRYKPSSLPELLDLINEKMLKKPVSDRLSQVEVFRKMYIELSPLSGQSNEDNKESARRILLGALLHRYFRLEAEYKRLDSKISYFLFSSSIKACRLHSVIKDILGLTKENSLDPLTVVTCCQAFHEHMIFEDNYKKHGHFKHDANFFPYLSNIIEEHSKGAAQLSKQVEGIDFLKSVAVSVDQMRQKIVSALQLLFKRLESNDSLYDEFNLDRVKNISLEAIKDEEVRQRVSQLISAACNYIAEHPESEDYESFKMVAEACLNARSQYALFGAFVVILARPIKMEQLEASLKLALKHGSENNINTDYETRLQGIRILRSWLLTSEGIHMQLNCKTWGSYEVFKDQVIAQEANLMKTMEQEEEKSIGFSLMQ